MKRKYILSVIVSLMILPIFGQNYIQVITSDVNIRFKPSSSSNVITQAKKGNIFELISKKGDWYEIAMFSGEFRFIHQTLCEKKDYVIAPTESEQLRKRIFSELIKAEDKATSDADKKYPNDIYKNIDYNRILDDKYKLSVINSFDLQPPVYSKILIEGVKKKWTR